jgi:hypothetical protein
VFYCVRHADPATPEQQLPLEQRSVERTIGEGRPEAARLRCGTSVRHPMMVPRAQRVVGDDSSNESRGAVKMPPLLAFRHVTA